MIHVYKHICHNNVIGIRYTLLTIGCATSFDREAGWWSPLPADVQALVEGADEALKAKPMKAWAGRMESSAPGAGGHHGTGKHFEPAKSEASECFETH